MSIPVFGSVEKTTLPELTRAIVRPFLTLGFFGLWAYAFVDGGSAALEAMPAWFTGLGVATVMSWFVTRPAEKLFEKVEALVERRIDGARIATP